MTKFIIDTWSWIAYFSGEQKGEKVKVIVEGKNNEILTHWIAVAEIVSIAKRKNLGVEQIIQGLFALSRFISGSGEFAVKAGMRHAEIRERIKDFGLIDACLLVAAEEANAKLVTGDPHFKGMKNVIMI